MVQWERGQNTHKDTHTRMITTKLKQPAISFSDDCKTNKSAVGMQHTPPWDIFNVKKMILKQGL